MGKKYENGAKNNNVINDKILMPGEGKLKSIDFKLCLK